MTTHKTYDISRRVSVLEEAIRIAVSVWEIEAKTHYINNEPRERGGRIPNNYVSVDDASCKLDVVSQEYQNLMEAREHLMVSKLKERRDKAVIDFLLEGNPFVVMVEFRPEMDTWCAVNTTGPWSKKERNDVGFDINHMVIFKFSKERDATLFKLFWYRT